MGATDRVKEYLDYKGITKYAFYKKTGLSNKFLDNSSNMGTNKAEIILHHYPDINPEWLLIGNGPMLREGILYEDQNKTSTLGDTKKQTDSKTKVPGYGNKTPEEIIDVYEKMTDRLQGEAERLTKELHDTRMELYEKIAEYGTLEIKYSELEEKLRECEGRRNVG